MIIKGHGAPTTATYGYPGAVYLDLDTRQIYEFVDSDTNGVDKAFVKVHAYHPTNTEYIWKAVSGGGSSEDVEYLKGLVAKTITEIDDTMFDTLGNEMFKGQNQLISAKFNNVTSMGYSVFESCSNLVSLELPNLVSCGTMQDMDGAIGLFDSSRIAYYASSLVTFKAPKLEAVLPKEFGFCRALVDVDISSATSIGIYSFNGCKNLVKIDLPKVTRIDQEAFNGCARLTAVILRSEEVVNLVNSDAFDNCHHILGTNDPMDSTANPDSLKDGYFYVPAALIDEYKVAENWSTFADQFRAIEDYPEIFG